MISEPASPKPMASSAPIFIISFSKIAVSILSYSYLSLRASRSPFKRKF
jgi:hypothetical protein